MVNVPTVVWIDERGRIARPNDVAFGTDTFRHITGIEAARHLGLLRALGARGDGRPRRGGDARAPDAARARPTSRRAPSSGSASGSSTRGRPEAAAAATSCEAGELAPHDFTIRRGTMPMRGLDPMGPEFRAMLGDWTKAGTPVLSFPWKTDARLRNREADDDDGPDQRDQPSTTRSAGRAGRAPDPRLLVHGPRLGRAASRPRRPLPA